MTSSFKLFGILFLQIFSCYITVYCEQVLSTNTDFQNDKLSRANINKCKCQCGQVLQDDICVNSTINKVPVWDETEEVEFLADESKFSSVKVISLTCEEGYSKIALPTSQFLIYTNGSLDNLVFIEEPLTSKYCIEHLQNSEGVTVVAEYCEANPWIPICCPNSHIITVDGECIFKAELAFQPLLLGDFIWSNYTWVEQKLECQENEERFTFPVSIPSEYGAAMVGHPLGSQLLITTDFGDGFETRQFEDYCVSVSETADTENGLIYEANFCRLPLKTEFEIKCKNLTCVRKCCQEGSIAVTLSNQSYRCTPNDSYSSNFTFYKEDDDGILDESHLTMTYGSPFCSEFHIMTLEDSNIYRKRINSQGHFLLNDVNDYAATDYCIDVFQHGHSDNRVTESVVFCYKEKLIECSWRWTVGSVLLAVSCLFYLLTLIVYISIKELRSKMVGKCLISQVSALFIAYSTLIFLQNVNSYEILLCHLPGTIEHMAILASFFWLNVMCFDMWRNISLFQRADVRGEEKTQRFILYSFYAWGCPLLIGLIRLVIDQIPDNGQNWLIKANFGDSHCFFANNYSVPAKWLYLYGPILIILVVNLGFFCHVAIVLMKQKRDSKLLNGPDSTKSGKNLNDRKKRAVMYLKLFLVMGISWILEIVMWLSVRESDCYFWGFDIVNALQGVFIFVIFVCKKPTLKKIKEKISFRVIHVKGIYELPERSKSQEEYEQKNTKSTNLCEEASTEHIP